MQNERANYGQVNAPPPAINPVPNALSAVDGAIARLHERVSNLEQRLSPILSPQPPSGVNAEGKLARHSLALQIESQSVGLNAACDRLDSIINRLEL